MNQFTHRSVAIATAARLGLARWRWLMAATERVASLTTQGVKTQVISTAATPRSHRYGFVMDRFSLAAAAPDNRSPRSSTRHRAAANGDRWGAIRFPPDALSMSNTGRVVTTISVAPPARPSAVRMWDVPCAVRVQEACERLALVDHGVMMERLYPAMA